MSERYINNLTGDFSICFSEHLTEHPTKLVLFCQIATQYLDELHVGDEYRQQGGVEYPIIYPLTSSH